MLKKVLDITQAEFKFEEFEEVSTFFKNIINQFKQMNYSEFQSESFTRYESELNALIDERRN